MRHQADKFYQKYLFDDSAETTTATSILDALSNAVCSKFSVLEISRQVFVWASINIRAIKVIIEMI